MLSRKCWTVFLSRVSTFSQELGLWAARYLEFHAALWPADRCQV